MALVLADRVKETTSTTGTGTVTLLGAVTGFQSFAVIGNANTTYYTIAGQSSNEWEVGIGTYTLSGTLLARTTVLSNSSGTQPSALSFSAGTKDVFVTYPSSKSVNLDASGNVTALGTPVSATLTNATGLPISTGVSGLGSNVATFLATPSSANLAAAVTDETGTGALVFATSPTLVTPALGTPSSGTLTNCTFPTLNQNTTGSAATLTTGRTIAITGDLAYTSPSFDGSSNVTAAGTLATVNSNVGSFTNASVTVNAKGLVTAASSGTAPVTSVTGTSPVASSGGATPAISLSAGYGDTLNPYASKTANFFLAAPNGTAGVPTFRAVVAADIPTLNQNTTGSSGSCTGNAATVTTNANLTGDVTSVGNATSIAAGVIVDADINASAAIVDTKLATISTASKVSNSATTATSANTASAIVARDASGNFTAGTITAALTGTASGNLVSGGALGTPSSGTLTNCTFPTLNQNTTGSAATLTTGRTIAITGDLAYTSGSFNGSANVTGTGTLATVNANVGSFTFSSITVNAKGLITAASSGSAPVEFAAGTRITFNQTTAPTGWTKSTSDDNKALRVVSGTVGSGGSVGFTTALATPTVTGSTSISVSISGTTGATTLTTAQIPSHTHTITAQTPFNAGGVVANGGSSNGCPNNITTNSTGGGGSHTHSFSGSGSGSGSLTSGVATINVAYVDVIIAQKN